MNNKVSFIKIFALILIITWCLFPNLSLAADNPLTLYINNIYTWAISIGGALTVLVIIWAGYGYATSGGDVEKVNQAKEQIIGAILGLVVLILAALILKSLGVASIS